MTTLAVPALNKSTIECTRDEKSKKNKIKLKLL